MNQPHHLLLNLLAGRQLCALKSHAIWLIGGASGTMVLFVWSRNPAMT